MSREEAVGQGESGQGGCGALGWAVPGALWEPQQRPMSSTGGPLGERPPGQVLPNPEPAMEETTFTVAAWTTLHFRKHVLPSSTRRAQSWGAASSVLQSPLHLPRPTTLHLTGSNLKGHVIQPRPSGVSYVELCVWEPG